MINSSWINDGRRRQKRHRDMESQLPSHPRVKAASSTSSRRTKDRKSMQRDFIVSGAGCCFVVMMTIVACVLFMRSGPLHLQHKDSSFITSRLHSVVIRKVRPVSISQNQWHEDGLTSISFKALEKLQVPLVFWTFTPMGFSPVICFSPRMVSHCTRRGYRHSHASSPETV